MKNIISATEHTEITEAEILTRHKVRKTSEAVIPAKAGIRHIADIFGFNILDTGFRRCDAALINTLVNSVISVAILFIVIRRVDP